MDMSARSDERFDLESLYNSAVLNAVPTGVLICDIHGNIIRANSELHRLFGLEQGYLPGRSISTLFPSEVWKERRESFERVFSAPEKLSLGAEEKLQGHRGDGSTFSMEIGLNPIDTPYGLQFIATITDITPSQLIENNFRKVFETAPIGILIIDSNGLIKHGNNQIVSIFGYAINEIRDQSLEILLPERHRGNHVQFRKSYADHPSSRAMGSERDLTGLHKRGFEFPVEVGLNPVDTEEGRCIIATVTDITLRKKNELKLKQLNADLDEFTYVASHDLKSPLRGIASLIEWIEEDIGDNITDDIRNNINRVNVRVERMEKLVEDLLSYARSGRQEKESRPIILNDLIQETIQLISPPESFRIDACGYLGEIYSYATPLETVLRNIISNAIKHHDKACGVISLNISTSGSYCIFEIQDDGPGVPTSAQERIFKLFQTLSNEDGTRSGVGLAVSKRMIESQGGRIEVISEEGKRGTCFKFWWPRFSRRDINEY